MIKYPRNDFDHVIRLPITASKRSERLKTAPVTLPDKTDKQPLLNVISLIVVVRND